MTNKKKVNKREKIPIKIFCQKNGARKISAPMY